VERALPSDRLTHGRQIGAALYGDVAAKRVSYTLGAFNGVGTNMGGNDSSKFLWVGRVSGVAYQGKFSAMKVKLTTGVNAFTTEDKGTFTGRRTGSGVDTQLVVGPAELQAEWLRSDLHPITGRGTGMQGWSLLSAISITRQVQSIVRYECFDTNMSVGRTTTGVWTFGFNYLIKGDDLKLSLNWLSGSQPAPAVDGGRFLGRVQVVF
jgi:phosphate-selective porin OprO/OprP